MKKQEKSKKLNRHAGEDIPSEQDRSWVGDNQIPQEQFDKTESEEKKVEDEPKCKCECESGVS